MAETSTPWNDAVMYEAEWRAYMQGAFGEGGIVNDYSGGALRTTASGGGTQLTVTPGQALICGVIYTNTAGKTLDLASFGTAPSSSQGRIDLVILRYTFATRDVSITVKAGSPSANPTEPTLTRVAGGVWEMRLARIERNGNTAVTQAMVTHQRTWVSPAGSASAVPDLAAWPVGSRVLTPAGELYRDPTGWSNLDQPNWSTLTLNSDLQGYTVSAQYRIVRGYVELRGGIQRVDEGVQIASANTPKTLFILPAGARPGRTYRYAMATTFSGAAATSRLTLDDTGRGEFVAPVDGTIWCTLDGISFQQVN